MKSLFLIAFAGLTLFAQEPQIKVHLTQPVAAGDNWLEAGDYTITTLSSASDVPVLRIQSDRGRSFFVFAAKSTHENVTHTALTIDNSGPASHIAKIDIEGENVEYTLANPTTHLIR